MKLYYYNTIYDNRTSLGTWPVINIIIIGQIETLNKSTPFCHIRFSSDENLIVQSNLIELSDDKIYVNDGIYMNYMLQCRINNYKIPVNIGLSLKIDTLPEYYHEILIPENPVIKKV